MKYLVTSALPYANGPLHFGHLAGVYIPADVYTRHLRLSGKEAIHISGSDEHGVAIEMGAKKEGKDFKEYVDSWHDSHKKLFKDFQIEFTYFGQTSAEYHHQQSQIWFKKLFDKGLIGPKESEQPYCNGCDSYLADRYVEGECYVCHYEDARGDECPNCGEWIVAIKLKNPVCKKCGSKDIEVKTVTQYYLLLSKFHKEYREWFSKQTHWRKTLLPYVDSLSKDELVDRAITRDLDWGVDVPLAEAVGKKMYVWFDAPIGYVSNTKKWIEEEGRKDDFLKDWWKNKDTQIVHFIGKDNVIFHCLIFPVMAMCSEIINPPSNVPANQYLNLEGKQFSKSSGWYVDAKQAVDQFGPTALRYYLASIIPEMTDSSFSWDQFAAKVNNELANNIGNFINRCLKFIGKNWPEGIEGKFISGFTEASKSFSGMIIEYNQLLDEVLIKRALDKVMLIGQEANTYFSDQAPWAQIKTDRDLAAKTLAYSTGYLVMLSVLLEPYLPELCQDIRGHMDVSKLDQEKTQRLYRGDLKVIEEIFENGITVTKIPTVLVPKVDLKVIEKLKEELQGKVDGE